MKKIFTLSLFASTSFLLADPAVTYASKCASCHGADGRKQVTHGESAVIAGRNAATTLQELQGYKAGTLNKYGMGGVMKNMVASLDDATMRELADYIAGL
ncbi:MAG TPA: c-type cytochrome [Epsilonproteobacteria bacterium]|nr:c-type cytochrome [Campylobacterota bacterium]